MAEKYRSIRSCFHRTFFYNAGDEYNPSAEELVKDKEGKNGVPEHFVKERDFSLDLVEDAEREDRNRQVFIKPSKAAGPPGPVA